MKHFRLNSKDFCLASKCLKSLKYVSFSQPFQICKMCQYKQPKPRHLICFKNWTTKMLLDILYSAINLKYRLGDSHQQNLNMLPNAKVMVLQEVNVPMLNMAVSKAASLMGAFDVGITDNVVWDQDYNGRIFSEMADIIFVSTATHKCIQRFANTSSVPVLCMMSRTHASLQSLGTVMAIVEKFKTMKGLNIAYVGPPHPILNSYLLLCPLLGANIRYKCSCKRLPVSPLLKKVSMDMTKELGTEVKQCSKTCDTFEDASVIIAGPTTNKKRFIPEFKLSVEEINKKSDNEWIFFHTCPRGAEVDDTLFWNENAMTFTAFQNMHYIAAALMVSHIRDYTF